MGRVYIQMFSEKTFSEKVFGMLKVIMQNSNKKNILYYSILCKDSVYKALEKVIASATKQHTKELVVCQDIQVFLDTAPIEDHLFEMYARIKLAITKERFKVKIEHNPNKHIIVSLAAKMFRNLEKENQIPIVFPNKDGITEIHLRDLENAGEYFILKFRINHIPAHRKVKGYSYNMEVEWGEEIIMNDPWDEMSDLFPSPITEEITDVMALMTSLIARKYGYTEIEPR